MRSSAGGCVLNNPENAFAADFFLNGFDIYKCAVALLARRIGR